MANKELSSPDFALQLPESFADRYKLPIRRRKRIWELDFLRGSCLVLMFLYHLAFDFYYIRILDPRHGGLPIFPVYHTPGSFNDPLALFSEWCANLFFNPALFWSIRIFSGAFLMLTGISCSLSRSNLKRGLRILAFGLIITAVTFLLYYTVGMDDVIVFGILSCIGLTITVHGLMELLEKKLHIRISAWVYIGIGIAVWILGYLFQYVFFSQSGQVPAVPADQLTIGDVLQIIVGSKMAYGDTFGLVPNAGKIFVGIGLGILLYRDRKASLLPKLDGSWNKPICWIGRHTFGFYVLHQPVVISVLFVIMVALGYTTDFQGALG